MSRREKTRTEWGVVVVCNKKQERSRVVGGEGVTKKKKKRKSKDVELWKKRVGGMLVREKRKKNQLRGKVERGEMKKKQKETIRKDWES